MKLEFISFQQTECLGVVQFATDNQNSFEFISSSEAIQKNFIEVTEISDSGAVNTIGVVNHSSNFVFFMDGDILSGAKQNRVLNTSVLIAPQTKTILPVSCVESGRWHHHSPTFSSTPYCAPSRMRQDKSMMVSESAKAKRGFFANQSRLWGGVSRYLSEADIDSPTSNLSDMYDRKEGAYEKFLESFKADVNANCVVFFINHKPINADIFNRTNIFNEYFPKLLKGVLIDAYGLEVKDGPLTEAEAKYKALELFDNVDKQEFTTHQGVALGEEKRFDSQDVNGFELSYNSHIIHSAIFCK